MRPASIILPVRIARYGASAAGLGIAAVTAAVVCAAIWQTQPIGDYTSVSGPVTASVDIIGGLPHCSAIGPVGLIDDGGSLYYDDWCTGTTYKDNLAQAPAREVSSARDGLTGGLALDRGTFYGIAGPGQSLAVPGVYTFDPRTLARKHQVAVDPCPGDGLTGLAPDPATGDLFASSWCGLWRISGPDTAAPAMRRIAAGAFDGIAVADGGSAVWAAGIESNDLIELSSAGAVITSVHVPGGPVGVALVAPTLRSPVAGDLFTSGNDGSLSMVDTHDGDKVTVVAAGGNRGEYLTVGPDGYLYVAKTDRIEQVQPAIFGPVTVRSQAGQGAPSAVALSAQAHAGAFRAGLPLIVTFAVIAAALTLLAALAGVARYRRRRERSPPLDPATPALVPATPPPVPGAGSDAEDPDQARRRLTDPGILPSAATIRLAVLLLMIIASTGSVYAHLNVVAHPGSEAAARGCLAAISLLSVANGTAPAGSALTVLGCLHGYAVPMAIWSLSGIAAVLTGTALLYALTPWWLQRLSRPRLPWRRPWRISGRAQRLPDLSTYNDRGKAAHRAVTALARQVGLDSKQMPALLVNPYSRHTDARAFGYRRRGYITLDRGLLEQFRTDRRAFDATMLHELAHLRQGDNLPTYLTYAAWRVFAALVLLPYAVSLVAPSVVGDPLDWRAYRFTSAAPDLHITAAVLVMAALVFLTSRAVLRIRETHADATAALHDNGALDELLERNQRTAEGKRRAPDWLHHHPGWERRRSDLKNPAVLAAADGMAMLAAGVAISLIAVNTWFVVSVGSLASWLPLERLLPIVGKIMAGDRGTALWFVLAIYGPGALIELAAIVALAGTTAWRAQLCALPGHARGSALRAGLPLVAGIMLGEPLSAIYADGGTWGVFDISVPRDLTDVAVTAAAITIIVSIVFWWAQESAAALIPVTRTSLRRPLAITVAAGVAGAAPALLTWMPVHDSAGITSFSQAVPALVSGWFGAHLAYIDYYPLTYLLVLPGTAVLAAVPSLRLVTGPAGRTTWPLARTALTAGITAAVIAELACFLLAIAARRILGAAALGAAFGEGTTGSPYLPLSWMLWIGAAACAIAAVATFRKAGVLALNGVLLTSFAGSSVAAVLLLAPLFAGFCGMRGFSCATAAPHDLLSFYGTMASEMPVYAAMLALPLLALTRPRGQSSAAVPDPGPARTQHWPLWQALVYLVILIALTGVYFEITQVLNFY